MKIKKTATYKYIKETVLSKPFTKVILIGLFIRLVLLLIYPVPFFWSDSNSYKELASYISQLSLGQYEGWRTPGYPLFLFISGGNYYLLVVIAQIILDIIPTFVIFETVAKKSKTWATISALFFFTLFKVIFYEFSILTETLTLCSVTTTLWLIGHWKVVELKQTRLQTIIVTLCLLCCFYVRPMYIYLSPVLAFFMAFHLKKQTVKSHIYKILLVLMVPMGGYFSSSAFNAQVNNWYTVTTFSGINLAQTCVSFFEQPESKHSKIAEIYIKHISQKDSVAEYSFQNNVNYYGSSFSKNYIKKYQEEAEALSIWRAMHEIENNTKKNRVEISKELKAQSSLIIKNNFPKYCKQVWRSWLSFWSHRDTPEKRSKHRKLDKVTHWGFNIQRIILTTLNILLIPCTLLLVIKSIIKKQLFNFSNYILVFIVAASVLQALVTYGGSPRFLFPSIPFIIIIVVLTIYEALAYFKTK